MNPEAIAGVAKLAPDAVAKRIAELKLMDDDVYIYDAKRLD
ncbi:hypothetical protein [Novosphingobium sp. CF614]|nr:hypothetical protein [Novosphingobium sp. CF614]